MMTTSFMNYSTPSHQKTYPQRLTTMLQINKYRQESRRKKIPSYLKKNFIVTKNINMNMSIRYINLKI